MKISDLKNKRIAILGFWKEGRSTLNFLKKEKITNITILDKDLNLESELKAEKHELGDSYLKWLENFDVIFKSPWVSPFKEELLPFRHKFTSQTELFFSNYRGKVIGITGTKGKSTISTLLTKCLEIWGYDVKLVWNIWSPVLDEVDIYTSKYDYIIYELSSYMLQDFAPELEIWYLNNIYPCHLDWHYDSFNIYREAKLNIVLNARNKIINAELKEDSEVLGIVNEKTFFNTKSTSFYDKAWYSLYGEYVYTWKQALNGEHNKINISGVILILSKIFKDAQLIRSILEELLPHFSGLPHRIENIWVFEGISFINDAIATTPESTIAAIKTFENNIQTLFLWGEDSGFNFSKIRSIILQSNISNIIAFPDTSEKIFPEIALRDYEKPFELEVEDKIIQFIKTRSMKNAVDFAYKVTLPGKVALLSCAAPSFSLWKSYIEKAEEFKKEVKDY